MDFVTILMESDRRFFTKYQRHLLYLVNTRIGRWYFCLSEHPKSRKFVKIEPNALFWRQEDQMVVEIRTANRYANRIKHSARGIIKLLKAISILGASKILRSPDFSFMASLPLFAGATYTFYPDAGSPGVTTTDGVVLRTAGGLGAGQSWAGIVIDVGTSTTQGSSDAPVRWVADNVASQWRIIGRGIFTFDARSLLGSVLSTATFSFTLTGSPTAPADASATKRELCVVGATPATYNNLVAADYSQLGGTRFGTLAFASAVGGGVYNDVSLNASGRAAISFSSVFGLGTRSGADVDATPPTWASFDQLQYTFNMAEAGGTSLDPKLTLVLSAVGVNLSDTMSMADVGTRTPNKVNLETVTLSDSKVKQVSQNKSETLSLSDVVITQKSTLRSLVETLTVSDSTVIATLGKLLTEVLSLADQVNKQRSTRLSDSMSMTDSSVQLKSAIRTMTDTMTMTDTKLKTPIKAPTDTITLSDTSTRIDTKRLSDGITLADSSAQNRGAALTLVESIALSDSILRTPAKLFLELVTLIESRLGFGNWASRVKPTTVWTNRTPPS